MDTEPSDSESVPVESHDVVVLTDKLIGKQFFAFLFEIYRKLNRWKLMSYKWACPPFVLILSLPPFLWPGNNG